MPLDSIAVLSILDRVTDANGNPVSGATLEFYEAGTTTPLTVYADAALTTSLGAVVTCDAGGYPTSDGTAQVSIYTGVASYKLIAKTAAGVVITTRDNIRGAPDIPETGDVALPNIPIISKSAAYQILLTDRAKLIDADPTGGSFPITLPDAVEVGDKWVVGVRHAGDSLNVVTVRALGSDKIAMPGQEEVSSCTLLGLGHTRWFGSNGANWTVIGEAPSLMSPNLPFIRVEDQLAAPPTSPTPGARYLINDTPTGAWATLSFAEHDIAESNGNSGWMRYTPRAGWFAYVVDEDRYRKFDGTKWVDQTGMDAAQSAAMQTAVFEHQETDGTAGGAANTGAWTQRKLTTSVRNDITGCSLASNIVTLAVGVYQIDFFQSFYRTTTTHARLKVLSGTATPDPLLARSSIFETATTSDNDIAMHGELSASGVLTVTATATVELQYYVTASSGGTSALGLASATTGTAEVYARLRIMSLATLQGPQGAQGPQGPAGPTGATGPASAAKVTFGGATATALTATSSGGVAASSTVICGTITSPPIGTTTLAVDGGSALPFRHASGRELRARDWIPGDMIVLAALGTEYRLLSPCNLDTLEDAVFSAVNEVAAGLDPPGIAERYLFDSTSGTSVPELDNVLLVIPVSGQSLALGAVSGPLVATSALYPDRVLRPWWGVRAPGSGVQRFSSLVNATEASDSGLFDTIGSSMVNHLYRSIVGAIPTNGIRIATFVAALGGQTYKTLRRGSPTYRSVLTGVEDMVQIAIRQGMRVIVPGVCWIQGESDTTVTSRGAYAAALEQYQRDLNSDIRKITKQAHDVVLYLSQTNHTRYEQGLQQAIPLAQLDASARGSLIRCVGPIYAFPMGTGDVLHKSAVGTVRMGQQFARALFADLYGTGWAPFRVREAHFVSSTVLQLDCDVPVSPIVIDTAGDVTETGLRGNKGFDVRDGTGAYLTISSVAVYNNTSIQLTLSAAPTTPYVEWGYAMRRNTDNNAQADGPVTGARGCIRDSAADSSVHETYTSRNWLVQCSGRVSTG